MSAHPESRRWLIQTEVENDPKLNLQAGAIGTLYANLRFGQKSKQKVTETTLALEFKGICRERRFKHPKRVWWLAFVEEGGAKPRFDIREREHIFAETDPAEEPAAPVAYRRCPLGRARLPRAACEAKEKISTDRPHENSVQENDMGGVIHQQRKANHL